MAWITGSGITDYRDMLDTLITIATADHVDTVVIVSGGTGYAVDDIITLTDGTFSFAAKFRVTSVAAGVIDGIQMEEGGAYTADPDLTATTAHTVAPAGGSGATFDLTMNSEPWTIERRAKEAVSAVGLAGSLGSGYTVGDDVTLTMDGGGVLGATGEGTTYGVAPVFNVDTIDGGGGITGLSLITAGHLEETPDVDGAAGLQANVTGGTGTLAVLTVTYQDVAAAQEDVVILSGPGTGGTDQILVGFRTFQDTDQSTFNTTYNWQLFGLVQFSSSLPMHSQINMSHGLDPSDGAQKTDGGSFMVLKPDDSDPDITFWMSVTNRRIILVCKVETVSTAFYSSMYIGFLDQFATEAEVPYPLWIQGCTSRENAWFGDTVIGRISGLSDMFAINSKLNGPAQHRVNGTWQSFLNFNCNDGGAPTRTSDKDFTMFPAGDVTYSPQADDKITDEAGSAGVDFQEFYPDSGVPGVPDMLLRPTPNTGDDIRILIPLSPIATDNTADPVYEPFGELNNCFWISASDPTTDLTSEDIQKIGDVRYIVFQNGNQTEEFSYFCVKVG